MPRGTVSEWNDEKGYGFICPAEGGRKLFFHISDFPRSRSRPTINQTVSFDRQLAERGEKAINVTPLSGGALPRIRVRLMLSIFISLIFLLIVLGLSIRKYVPLYAPLIYVAASLLAFNFYRLDKRYAQAGEWRVSEQTLHFYSLIGGWPGALVAQQFFRHKSRKISFRVTFWLTVAINCIALALVANLEVEAIVIWVSEQFRS